MNSSKITEPFESEPSNYEEKLRWVNSQIQTKWNYWYDKLFELLVPFNKWKQQKPNLTINSIVLFKFDKKFFKSEYRMARVLEVQIDVDGLMRTLEVGGNKKRLLYKSTFLNADDVDLHTNNGWCSLVQEKMFLPRQ